MMVHAYNPSIQEVEAGGSQIQGFHNDSGQYGIHESLRKGGEREGENVGGREGKREDGREGKIESKRKK